MPKMSNSVPSFLWYLLLLSTLTSNAINAGERDKTGESRSQEIANKCSMNVSRAGVLTSVLNLCFRQRNSRDEFKKIDKFLTQELRSSPPATIDSRSMSAEALKQADRWLRRLRTNADAKDQQLIDSLENFVALRELDDDRVKCSSRSREILHFNDEATGWQKKETKGGSLDLVLRVFLSYANEHARFCIERRIPKLLSSWNQIDSLSLRLVEALVRILQTSRVNKFHLDEVRGRLVVARESQVNYARSLLSDVHDIGRLALLTMRSNAAHDPEISFAYGHQEFVDPTESARRFDNLYQKYIQKPCEDFLISDPVSLFKDSEDELRYLSRENSEWFNSAVMTHYRNSWVGFRLCSLLLAANHEKLRSNMMFNINILRDL